MREIKFRRWYQDKLGKKMMTYLEGTKEKEYRDGDGNNWTPLREIASPDRHSVWMQFTGLKDKNNVEIYEGDIVEFRNADTAIVEFDSKHAQFVGKIIKTMKEKYPTYNAFFGYDVFEDHKVIGNVFEHPELLGVKKMLTKKEFEQFKEEAEALNKEAEKIQAEGAIILAEAKILFDF